MNGRVVNVGLCGFGVVGQGVLDHLERKREMLQDQLGVEVVVARVAVRNKSKTRDIAIDAARVTDDALSVAVDPELDIVCELMGGTDKAREVTLEALKAGKIVVTAKGIAVRPREGTARRGPGIWRPLAFRSECRGWHTGDQGDSGRACR